MRLVLAIGGNALLDERQRGTWAEQLESADAIVRPIADLSHDGHEVVLTHGNGPQVGALHLQHALGENDVARLPLDVLVAMTQGQLGYLLQTAMTAADPAVPVVAVLTRVRVDADDPAFENPTKPIGPFYDEAHARREEAEHGWRVGPDAGRGWRELVPSPHPREIVELEQLRALVDAGTVVIAAGGGGVPVVARDGRLAGVEAVIDKDRCSAELALAVEADVLVLLTAVPRVAIDFGTRWERPIDRMTAGEAGRLLAEGEFPPGSMGPKIEAARRFVEASGRSAVVTSGDRLRDAVRGVDGTWIVADSRAPAAA